MAFRFPPTKHTLLHSYQGRLRAYQHHEPLRGSLQVLGRLLQSVQSNPVRMWLCSDVDWFHVQPCSGSFPGWRSPRARPASGTGGWGHPSQLAIPLNCFLQPCQRAGSYMKELCSCHVTTLFGIQIRSEKETVFHCWRRREDLINFVLCFIHQV